MVIENESDLCSKMQGEREIILYGAGEVAKNVLTCLRREGIEVQDVAVSDPEGGIWEGYELIPKQGLASMKHRPVIVGTSAKFRDEIVADLTEMGFNNIFTLSDRCVAELDFFTGHNLFFQTHIVDHCNLKCRGCYHFSSLAEESFLSVDEFEKDVSRLSKLLHGKAREIMLLGGEPLLHPCVGEFFRIARNYFETSTLKLLTNGLLLLKMDSSFFQSMVETDAELWVTKYPVAFDYKRAERHALTYGVKIHYFNEEPVRSLGHQPLDLSGEQDYVQNFSKCYRANTCVDLKHGKLYSCVIPAEIEPFCNFFHVDIPVGESDGVNIYEVATVDELFEKLRRPMPFCRFCNRKAIEMFGSRPWERTKYKIEEWTD